MSISFKDGPAAGVTLMLRRAPILLRVTCKLQPPDLFGGRPAASHWDALDQLQDQAGAGETIYVYVLDAKPTFMHLLVRGKNRAMGGRWPVATYKLFAHQPSQSLLRDNTRWSAWADQVVGSSDCWPG